MNEKLIIYELNEFPKKLLDFYTSLRPNSNISKLRKYGQFLETFTTDKGELHPWTTWSTFYRGVDSSLHKITSLNQKLKKESFPPIWQILIKKDVSIGIFGSLQSYPPIKDKKVKFYLPDTFAPNCEAYPNYLENFQKFNLSLVSNNSGKIRSISKNEIKYFLSCIFRFNIRLRSCIKIIAQLIREKINQKFKKRRSLLQPELTFDIYYRCLKKNKPEFSTFFTNHLAGMMHYYWLDIFPSEFNNQPRNPKLFNRNSVIKALDLADKQIGILKNFAKKNSYELWIASSMGQNAIKRKKSNKLFLKDFNKIISKLGLNSKLYKQLPSMYPDINIESNSEKNIDRLIEKILEVRTYKNSEEILNLRYRQNKKQVNLIFGPIFHKEEFLKFKNKKINIKDLGLEYENSNGNENVGTGYHIPEGILLTYGNKSKELLKNKQKIDTKLISPVILKFFNIKKRNYMINI